MQIITCYINCVSLALAQWHSRLPYSADATTSGGSKVGNSAAAASLLNYVSEKVVLAEHVETFGLIV